MERNRHLNDCTDLTYEMQLHIRIFVKLHERNEHHLEATQRKLFHLIMT